MCGFSRENANCSLRELNDLLQASCEAVTRFQGGDTYYSEELQIFREIAEEQRYLLKDCPRELNETPSDAGNEHQMRFRKDKVTFLKATHPNFFGKKGIYRTHDTPDASPIGFVNRWLLSNDIFGDKVVFLGGLETPRGLRLLIEQPAIIGRPATLEESDLFFTRNNWQKIVIEDEIAY